MIKKLSILLLFFFINTNSFFAKEEFFPLEDIEIGMKGTAYTVLKGYEPISFEVEVIDVMENYFVKGSLILAKINDPTIAHIGVMAGMSGSPFYIDGKLVGAIGYTWSFIKDPIVGITPITQMVESKDLSVLHENFLTQKNQTDEKTKQIKPISMPIMLSGFHKKSENYLENSFSKKGFKILNAGSAKKENFSSKSDLSSFKGGDGIAIGLIEGDMTAAAIGTVSYVDGDDIYMFAHPFGDKGAFHFPLSRAYIYTVIPNYSLSFKMGSPSKTIATTDFDGTYGVYGTYGDQTSMIPVSIDIRFPNETKTLNVKIVDHKSFLPDLAFGVLQSSLYTYIGDLDEKTLKLSSKIYLQIDGKEKVIKSSYEHIIFPSMFSQMEMVSQISNPLSILYDNFFKQVKLQNISYEVEILPSQPLSIVSSMSSDKNAYKRGEKAFLKVLLQDYQGKMVKKQIELDIPNYLKKGTYQITLLDALSYKQAILDPSIIKNMDELVKYLSVETDQTKAYIFLALQTPQVTIEDKDFIFLPHSKVQNFSTRDEQGLLKLQNLAQPVIFDYKNALFGHEAITIEVQ